MQMLFDISVPPGQNQGQQRQCLCCLHEIVLGSSVAYRQWSKAHRGELVRLDADPVLPPTLFVTLD